MHEPEKYGQDFQLAKEKKTVRIRLKKDRTLKKPGRWVAPLLGDQKGDKL